MKEQSIQRKGENRTILPGNDPNRIGLIALRSIQACYLNQPPPSFQPDARSVHRG
jgi:hypothetical protein